MTPAEMVAEFHHKLCDPATQTVGLRNALIREEVSELTVATDAGDLVGMADALADCVYVLYGTAHVFGIDLDAVLAEVHRSNMSKELGPGGKAVKGPTFSPADVDSVLSGRPAPVGSWWRGPGGQVSQVSGDYLDGPGDQIVTYTEYQPDGTVHEGKWGGKEFAAAYTRIEAHEVPDWVEVAW